MSTTTRGTDNEEETSSRGMHILCNFQLEPKIDPRTNDMTVIAHLPDKKLQDLGPIAPEQERLHEIYICLANGRLERAFSFTETEYRSVMNEFIRYGLTASNSQEEDDSTQTGGVSQPASEASFVVTDSPSYTESQT
ncbi:hypothetical protein AWZ03_014274 [Drosophila navojoa]|uniref:Uncharacterized protein n=1 Tax=Drosophila navojoa TaxID=7232 RepID=A0A484AUT0_DRONA|nr:hypothetical protein AWZ03_014274 [Drosophila navojoa]